MPCRDDRDDGGYQYAAALKTDLDTLTNLLCLSCKSLERTEKEYNLSLLPKEVKTWWEAHKKCDAEREAAEKAVKEQAHLKEKALKKLTLAERKALGL